MPYNLTPSATAPGYTTSSKFGAGALSANSGTCANPYPTNGTFTLEGWVQTTNSGTKVAMGANGTAWIGSNGTAPHARYGNGSGEVQLTGAGNIADGAYHHMRLVVGPNGGRLYLDGVQVASNAATMSAAGAIYTNQFGIHTFAGVGGYDWIGTIDEVALFSTELTTGTSFTPPTVAYANGTTGIKALWHLDNDLTDSATSATLPGAPTIGTLTAGTGVMSITFTPGTSGTNSTTSYIATASTGEIATGTASPIAFSAVSAGARTVHVQAISVDGTGPASAESNSATVTSSGDVTPPTLTGSVTLGTPGTTSIPISYPAGSDNVGVAGYEASVNGGTSFTSVGNTTSPTLTGLSSSTAYPAVQVRAFDAAGNRSTPVISSASGFTTVATSGFTDNITFSPGNWNVQPTFAQSINPGASFEFVATGTAATLNFDVSGLVAPFPQFTYQIDRHGPMITATVAATVVMTPASDTSDYANKGGHFYEVLFKSASETVQRWSPQQAALRLTGITVDSGAAVSKPQADVRGSMMGFSDSIFETVRSVNSTATNDTDRNDAAQGFMLELSRQLGLRYGNVGFGATGYTISGSGGVPALPNSIGFIYSGVPRTFPSDMVAAVVGAGINDGGANVQTAATTVINYLLANMPAYAVVFVMRPLNGGHETQLQAAIAASTNPARCFYINTAGIFRSADSSDNLHPYGPENIRIARMVASLMKPNLPYSGATPPVLTARTVSMTLKNASGPMANLTNLQVSVLDDPTRAAGAVVRYQTTTGTTDANGLLSFTYQSALASGGTCAVDIRFANNQNMAVNPTVT